MRCVYLSTSAVPSRDADAVHVVHMCAGLAALGLTVRLVARHPTAPVLDDDASADVYAFYGIDRGPEIVYAFEPPIPGRSTIGALASVVGARIWGAGFVFGRDIKGCYVAAALGIPVIFESHAPLDWYPPHEQWMGRRLLKSKNLRGLVVISQPLRAIYEGVGLASEKIVVAPDGALDPGRRTPMPLGPPDRLQVGYVGHLWPGRGIEIIELMAEQCPFADFHVAGGMPDQVAAWRQRIADAANLTIHGFLTPSETMNFRAACDVLVAPYQEAVEIPNGRSTAAWMSPLKLFEYMAAGKAIVCSDLPVLHEIFVDGRDALLCPPASVEAWVAALRRLADDANMRERLGYTARARFLENYTWSVRARRILEACGVVVAT